MQRSEEAANQSSSKDTIRHTLEFEGRVPVPAAGTPMESALTEVVEDLQAKNWQFQHDEDNGQPVLRVTKQGS